MGMFKGKKLSVSRTAVLITEGVILLAMAVLFAAGNHLPSKTRQTDVLIRPVITETPDMMSGVPEYTATPFPTEEPTEIPTPTPVVISAVDYFLADTNQERYASWIRKLSGDEPVIIGGQEYTITTRYSYAMFLGQDNAKAPEYLMEVLKQWVPEDMITYEPYEYRDATYSYTWYNIIVTFPGTVSPDEQVLYTAHFDSTVQLFDVDQMQLAPGANDNGTGVAALLEAIPTFAKTSFDKTVKVIFFSGEENQMQGSTAYTAAHGSENIVGVINMDMFGNDPADERCFEIQVGADAASDRLGQPFRQAI